MYKICTPQGRIPDKFTVLEEPREQSKTHVFLIFIQYSSITMSACYL